jgi:hypothetical protein
MPFPTYPQVQNAMDPWGYNSTSYDQ